MMFTPFTTVDEGIVFFDQAELVTLAALEAEECVRTIEEMMDAFAPPSDRAHAKYGPWGDGSVHGRNDRYKR